MPVISVVIPTHHGADRLGATLASLADQTLPPRDYEIIVALDGPDPATRESIAAARMPCTVTVVEQAHAGAAQARNLGAAAARGPLVLFLDDDMSGARGLLAAHLRSHELHPGGVVIGCFAQSRLDQRIDLLADGADIWWADHFARLMHPGHRFSFRDFCTGNVSLPLSLFLDSGGFSAEFREAAGEDYEFGIRLLLQRVRFRFAADAVSCHRHVASLGKLLDRARQEGRGHVIIARLHPTVFPELPLRNAVDDGPVLKGDRTLRLTPRRLATLPALLRASLPVASALKLRRLSQKLLGALRVCAYWEGACQQTGSWAELQAFVQDLPLNPIAHHELEFDLAKGMDALELALAKGPLDAIRLRYGSQPIGRIAPRAGAEPLRTEHVRHALEGRFAKRFLVAATESVR
jgi:glycosyltransferase involved in cell wall biosynthesis